MTDPMQDVHELEMMERAIYSNPYKHFYHKIELAQFDAESGVAVEDYEDAPYDAEVHQEYLDEMLTAAKKNKAAHLAEAMKFDPAFMVDPVNQHYKPLLKKALGEDKYNALSEEQLMEVVALIDPVTWGEKYLLQTNGKNGKWEPRNSRRGIPYQSMLIRSKSKNIAARAGRRIGKTAALVVRLLHKAFTFTPGPGKPTFNMVMFTPNQSQINVIFKMMEVFIDKNPHLMSMVAGSEKKIPTRRNPQTMLELTNGVTIFGFVSGSSAIRGSAADVLVLDEGSFLTTEDTDAVVALLNEHEDVEFWVSSTPKGLKDYFYERVHDKDTVDFYFPTDKFHPGWSHQMEQTFRSQLTEAGYNHEVLADFSADGEGVFQAPFVEAAQTDYEYDDCKYDPNWLYGIGVDWNDTANGSQIVVVGYNPKYKEECTKPYKVVDKRSVSVEGWTQTTAVNVVRDMNRKWQASFVYTDYGFGATQNELLHDIGRKALKGSIDHRLVESKSINFSQKFEVRDPWLQKKIKKPAKPYMINNAVRIFEDLNIEIPKTDEWLSKQLLGYTIDAISPLGIPRYAADPKMGDHQLDALVLALLGFHMELSTMGKPIVDSSIGFTTLGIPLGFARTNPNAPQMNEHDRRLQADKDRERKEVEDANRPSRLFEPATIGIARRVKPERVGLRTYMAPRKSRNTF